MLFFQRDGLLVANNFEKTRLWKQTLGREGPTDEDRSALERLRVAYYKMRTNVSYLVSQIHSDCRGLTLHDVTHLDALWEMGDLITGPKYPPLTPAEAFVLGGAILLHDAGLTVAAYPGGLAELKQTPEWRDNLEALKRSRRLSGDTAEHGASTLDRLEAEAIFSTLRDLHAKVAEKLATQEWDGPQGPTYIIEDADLRKAFGQRIGKIAHSHHWDVERLPRELGVPMSAPIGMPSTWIVEPIKVACILRCADAAHIDERRAPTFLYAITKPEGISEEHWSFQNKLNQAAAKDSKLIYSSGVAFNVEDVPAWWRLYDTIGIIDKELRQTSALMEERQLPQFQIQGVEGADQPRLLALHVGTNGWEPVNVAVEVSDPVNLARILGGQNLYGKSPVAVIRELLQNAVDAVRARRKWENRGISWGQVKVEIVPEADRNSVWLHISDNGIGMSQNVLTTTLVDFGKSIWNSAQLREEYPGLLSGGIKPVGKFRIGFFSVFIISDRIKVASKRYNDGDSGISVLEFSGLSARPILRKGSKEDLPNDISTRVSLRIDSMNQLKPQFEDLNGRRFYRPSENPYDQMSSLPAAIQRLIAGLDVNVEFISPEASFSHGFNWDNSNPRDFLTQLYGNKTTGDWGPVLDTSSAMLEILADDDGHIFGRAALKLPVDRDSEYGSGVNGFASVGGFSVPSDSSAIGFLGVLEGEVINVSRSRASIKVPQQILNRWLVSQADLLLRQQTHPTVQIKVAQGLFDRGIKHEGLPMCFFDNRPQPWSRFKERLTQIDYIQVPLRKTYNDNFETIGIKNLRIDYANMEMCPESILFACDDLSLLPEAEAKAREVSGDMYLSVNDLKEADKISPMIEMIEECWGNALVGELRRAKIFAHTIAGFGDTQWSLWIGRKK